MIQFQYVTETPDGLKVIRPMPKKTMRGKEYTLATVLEDWEMANQLAEGIRDEGLAVVIKKETRTIYQLWCRQVEAVKIIKASKNIEA